MLTRRAMVGWLVAAGIVGVLVLGVGLNMLGRYTGLTVERMPPETVLDMLAPYFQVTRPEGAGPFPTALLFSGCDGPTVSMNAWSDALAEAGWASIMIDSHTPRGLHEPQLWPLVCAGQVLTGAERAGDVAVALAHAQALSFVDSGRIAMVGASHGGWAILEFFSMADNGQVPLTLERWPAGIHARATDGVSGAVLLYPYCGELSRATRQGWEAPIPVLFILAEDDAIADETDCLEVVAREGALGLPVVAEVFSGVTHAFDHVDASEFSPSVYDPEATARAMTRMTEFLKALPR